MSFTAQEQLAKGDVAGDMQNGSRGEIMQLEAIELQEPVKEWMDWKSKSPRQERDKAYPLPLGWVGNTLRLLPAIIGGEPGSDGDHIRWREKSVSLQLY